jgi:IS30 family transposase
MTTTTSRDWDVEAAYLLSQQINPDTGRNWSVRAIAAQVGKSHQAVAVALKEKRGGPATRPRLLPYETSDAAQRSYTYTRLRLLIKRERGEKLSETHERQLEHWLNSRMPGMILVYDVQDEDWAWRRPQLGDKTVYGFLADRPDE